MVAYTRQAHVVRIKNPSDASQWVDVLRLDYFGAVENAGAQGHGFHLKWQDSSGDGTGDSANPLRTSAPVTVKDKGNTTICDVPAITSLTTNDSGQRSVFRFNNNKAANAVRAVQNVRIYPVNIGSTDPTTPMTWEDYKTALEAGTADTSKWVTMAVPTAWGTKQQQGPDYQGATRHMRWRSLVDALANTYETSDNTNAVWLDPLQIIVNWSGSSGSTGYPTGVLLGMGGQVIISGADRLVGPVLTYNLAGHVDFQTWSDQFGTGRTVSSFMVEGDVSGMPGLTTLSVPPGYDAFVDTNTTSGYTLTVAVVFSKVDSSVSGPDTMSGGSYSFDMSGVTADTFNYDGTGHVTCGPPDQVDNFGTQPFPNESGQLYLPAPPHQFVGGGTY